MEDKTYIDRLQLRHSLVQEEFRSILTSSEYKVPIDTEAVVALSAALLSENRERVAFSVEIIKQIVAKKSGKSAEEVNKDDIMRYSPPLVLNGTTENLPDMTRIGHELEFPEEKIQLVNCGERETANTKTQFEAMDGNPLYANMKHMTFITSDYHVPRVIRTADKNLNSETHFDVLPVPRDRVPYNVFRVIRGEVRKIESYSAKGDITRTPLPR